MRPPPDWTNSPIFPDDTVGDGPSVSAAGTMVPHCTPAVSAAASYFAIAALAGVSKTRVTVWSWAPSTVTNVVIPWSPRDPG
jgi:hypothetical protein